MIVQYLEDPGPGSITISFLDFFATVNANPKGLICLLKTAF